MNMSEDLAFIIETAQCSPIKTLFETLKGTLTNVAFYFDKEKILVREINKYETIFINLELYAENFERYEFNLNKQAIIGIKINNLYDVVKSINNKNILMLSVNNSKLKDYINVSFIDTEAKIRNDYELFIHKNLFTQYPIVNL